MPQMSPLMWSNLFILFSMIFLLTFIKIYFFSSKLPESSPAEMSNKTLTKINWTW